MVGGVGGGVALTRRVLPWTEVEHEKVYDDRLEPLVDRIVELARVNRERLLRQ